MMMRVRGIKRVTVRKGGKLYVYYRHRATGETIGAEFNTAAFAAQAAALDAKAKARNAQPLPGSLGLLVASYRKSPEFTALKPRTRSDYERVLVYLRPLDDMPLIAATTAELYGIRDKAYAAHKRRFANYVVQVLNLVLEWGRKRGYIATNPAREVDRIRRPRDLPRANRPWTDAERETVLAAASSPLRVMIALGMFVGLREGDACRLLKSSYDGSAISAIAAKNGEPLWIPAHFRLRQILADAAKVSAARRAKRKVVTIEANTLALNSRGQKWTGSGFRASFFKLIRELETDGKIGRGLSFHGLRHTVGKLVIEAGGTTRDVGTVLGDRSSAMAEHYSRDYDRKARVEKTMRKLERIERGKMDKQRTELDKPKKTTR